MDEKPKPKKINLLRRKGGYWHSYTDMFACACLVYMTIKIYEFTIIDIKDDFIC